MEQVFCRICQTEKYQQVSGLIEAAARNAVVPGGFVFSSVGRFQGCIGFCQVWSAGNRVSDGISHLI